MMVDKMWQNTYMVGLVQLCHESVVLTRMVLLRST